MKLTQGIALLLSLSTFTVSGKDTTPQISLVQYTLENLDTSAKQGELLTLDRAIMLALENNPDLRASKQLILASEARVIQEAKLQNPELDVELENFAGSGPLGGTKALETTVLIQQPIELGKKRAHRVGIASAQYQIRLYEHEKLKLDVISNVRKHFSEVLVAQQRVELDQQLLELSAAFSAEIDTLVKAGRYSPAEKARAQVEYSMRLISSSQNERLLQTARIQLAEIWGGDPINNTIAGGLPAQPTILELEDVFTWVDEYPAVAMSRLEGVALKAEQKLAEAMRIPDPALGFGLKSNRESNDRAFVAGLSIPIPLLNRNQGGIEEAQHKVQWSERSLEAARVALLSEVSRRVELIKNLTDILHTLNGVVIPEAERAYAIINRNYRMGQYSTLDVLDAQRNLFEAQITYLDTQLEYNIAIIELEGLLGRSVLNP